MLMIVPEESTPAAQVAVLDGKLVGYLNGRRYTMFGDEADTRARDAAERWLLSKRKDP